MAAPTWSIIYVPIAAGGGGVIAGGIITMKPAAFYRFVYGQDIAAADAAAAGAAGAAGAADAGAGAAAAVPAAIPYAAPAAGAVADDMTAAATAAAQIQVTAAAAANDAANAYFNGFFTPAPAAPLPDTARITAFFDTQVGGRLTDALAAPAAGAAGDICNAINTAGSSAYLLLMQYDGVINTANHINTFYHKYTGGDAASKSGALFNVFNTVNPGVGPARVGGMIRYKKQSKKHRRKYSKGRTARR